MKWVTKEEFYRRIFAGKLDVHPEIVSSFPFTSVWSFPRKIGRPVFGKTVDRVERGQIVTDHFLAA